MNLPGVFAGSGFYFGLYPFAGTLKIPAGDPGKSGGGTAENKDFAGLMGVC